MSANNNGSNNASKKPTTATIKIAAKEASKRVSAGGADPGPGDMNAEPSAMPEPVSIPAAPTASELVVKSSKNSRNIKTIQDPVSLPKSAGSSASTVLRSGKTLPTTQNLEDGADFGAASTKTLQGSKRSGSSKNQSGTAGFAMKSTHGSSSRGKTTTSGMASANKTAKTGAGLSASANRAYKTMKSSTKSVASPGLGEPASQNGPTASADMQADSQANTGNEAQQDVIEDQEAEVEQPDSPSPMGASAANQQQVPETQQDGGGPATGGLDEAPPSSAGKLKTSSRTGMKKSSSRTSHGSEANDAASRSPVASGADGKKGKHKVTKFRYHKRVTVRTHGKTSPSAVMDQVAKKQHQARMTPSTIEEMDEDELMKRAGIKGNKKTHWRVRLRQTKRTTKNGKTVTETRVAYRDSEGHKRIRTSDSPYCKKCKRKLEDCNCSEK